MAEKGLVSGIIWAIILITITVLIYVFGLPRKIQGETPVDGGFSSWTTWTPCLLTCGAGSQHRERRCNNPPPRVKGKECEGAISEAKECNTTVACPVDGQWTTWDTWSQCSKTCSEGKQRRDRVCEDPPPQNGGRGCTPPSWQVRKCFILHCPVPGNWGAWGQRSACSVTCETGMRTQTRHCDSPAPQHGGEDCPGDGFLNETCVNYACPVNPDLPLRWGPWAQWTSSGSLDHVRHRELTCLAPDSHEEVDISHCRNDLPSSSEMFATEVGNALALPWPQPLPPGPGRDCFVYCMSDCEAVAYNPASEKCYVGAWNSSSPIVTVNDVSKAWTLIIVEKGPRSNWKLKSESGNVLTLGTQCMTNVVLSHLKEKLHIGPEITKSNPGQAPAGENLFVWAYFKESGEFLFCGDYQCYTWHFGQTSWTLSYKSEKFLNGVAYIFVDDDATKLMLLGGRDSPGDMNRGAQWSQYLTLAHGFEEGPYLRHAGMQMGVVMLPDRTVLHCGGNSLWIKNDCHIVNLADGSSEKAEYLPYAAYNFEMVRVKEPDGKWAVYASSGAENFSKYAYRYDIEGDRWGIGGYMRAPYKYEAGHRMFVLDNQVYAFWVSKDGSEGPITRDELVWTPGSISMTVQATLEQEICYGFHAPYEVQALIKD